jgi:hypothetical protein
VKKWINEASIEHDVSDLARVDHVLPLRERVLLDTVNRFRAYSEFGRVLDDDQIFKLASTDLFVEKAQIVLTRRSNNLMWAGGVSVFVTFILLGLMTYGAHNQIKQDITDISSSTTPYPLIIRIFQTTAYSGFGIIAIRYLIALARSFFQEATNLRERRHALRFGRLYIYLTKGEADFEKLEEAFQWNKASSTSFLDVKADVMTETLLGKVIDGFFKAPAEVLKTAVEVAAKAKKD